MDFTYSCGHFSFSGESIEFRIRPTENCLNVELLRVLASFHLVYNLCRVIPFYQLSRSSGTSLENLDISVSPVIVSISISGQRNVCLNVELLRVLASFHLVYTLLRVCPIYQLSRSSGTSWYCSPLCRECQYGVSR
jgi:hypothetical protein